MSCSFCKFFILVQKIAFAFELYVVRCIAEIMRLGAKYNGAPNFDWNDQSAKSSCPQVVNKISQLRQLVDIWPQSEDDFVDYSIQLVAEIRQDICIFPREIARYWYAFGLRDMAETEYRNELVVEFEKLQAICHLPVP